MKDDCLAKICQFARDFRAENILAPRQLYDATGYATHHSQITQEDIEASLRQNLSLIDDWLRFTEDKRWSPAWGFGRTGEADWVLIHITATSHCDYELRFSSAISACALMIRLEMEDFRYRQP